MDAAALGAGLGGYGALNPLNPAAAAVDLYSSAQAQAQRSAAAQDCYGWGQTPGSSAGYVHGIKGMEGENCFLCFASIPFVNPCI